MSREFGGGLRGDTLYEAVSEGRRHPGLEHWLPLFYDGLDTLFDYIGGAPLVLDPLAEEAASERLAQIRDYYDARKSAHDADPANSPYKPLPPDALYLPARGMDKAAGVARRRARHAFFAAGRRQDARSSIAAASSAAISRPSAPTRAPMSSAPRPNMFKRLQAQGKRVVVAGWSEGSRERLGHVLKDFGIHALEPVSSFGEALRLPKSAVALAVIGLESRLRGAAISRSSASRTFSATA